MASSQKVNHTIRKILKCKRTKRPWIERKLGLIANSQKQTNTNWMIREKFLKRSGQEKK